MGTALDCMGYYVCSRLATYHNGIEESAQVQHANDKYAFRVVVADRTVAQQQQEAKQVGAESPSAVVTCFKSPTPPCGVRCTLHFSLTAESY